MPVRVELNLRLPNSPGALARLCGQLSDEGVNILALGLEASGLLRLLVDNHVRAAGVLRSHNHQVSEKDVLVVSVPNGPGGLRAGARLVADAGFNIDYAYGGAPEEAARGIVVLGVENPARAAAAAGV